MKTRKDRRGSFHYRDPIHSKKMASLLIALSKGGKVSAWAIQAMGFLNPSGAVSELRRWLKEKKDHATISPAIYEGETANGSRKHSWKLVPR